MASPGMTRSLSPTFSTFRYNCWAVCYLGSSVSSFCPLPIRKTNAMPPQTPPVRTKLHTPESLDRQLAIWRSRGDEIVFTNGCFDILHAGHITYLEQAAGMGERLVIGVNDDASVARLKGASRPINALESRMYLLASLSF